MKRHYGELAEDIARTRQALEAEAGPALAMGVAMNLEMAATAAALGSIDVARFYVGRARAAHPSADPACRIAERLLALDARVRAFGAPLGLVAE
ncbi:hypothetical protein [Caenispirillum bisanense]|uniref:hypothetical protein n=1 Tax=Caenispirillum bisanense TaxID=414052 RepID=UPI0031E465D2